MPHHVSSRVGIGFLLQGKKILLSVCYGIFLVELLAIAHNSSADLFTLLMAGSFFLITMFKPFWGVWSFVAVMPFLNGCFVLDGMGDTSLAFTAVFLAWLPRYFLKNKSSQSVTTTSFFTHLLATIVFLNLCLVAIRVVEWPIPSRYWLEWASSFPYFNQADPLWQINAALILLKGIVLFQMVELEITGPERWVVFSRTIYIQASCVAVFSLFQFIDFKTNGVNFLGLTSPFNDIHSYGSAVVLIFIVLVGFFLNSLGKHKINKEKIHGANKRELKMVLIALLVIIFFFLCLYSSSRVTWLAMGMLLFIILAQTVKNKKVIVYAIVTLLVIFFAGSLFVPNLIKSDNPSLYRLGTLLNVKDLTRDEALTVRYELWNRSLKMVKEYPFTGVGIGNVYRNIQSYKDRTVGQWDMENSHNYYLQLAAELGMPALILFICILLSLYSSPVNVTLRGKQNLLEGISLRPFRYGLGAYLLTMLTGHPLLLSSQQFLFWPVVAIISKGQLLLGHTQEKPFLKAKILKKIGIISFFLYVFFFSANVYRQEPWTIPVTYGFYSTEDWNGVSMRWMSGKAEYYLPAERRRLLLKVVAQPFNSRKPEGLTLTISINNSVVDRVHFLEGESKMLSYRVSSANGRDNKINLEVDRVFSPRKIGLSQDFRLLGVAIGELDEQSVIPAVPVLLLK